MPYSNFLAGLATPRAGTYKRVFRTTSDVETTGAVLWGQAMGMALMSLALTFEVTMRNRIHKSLSIQASTKLNGHPVDSFAWYDSQLKWLSLSGESQIKVEKILSLNGCRLAKQPSPDHVVSRLSFGFWSNVLDSQLTTPVIEVRTFADLFSEHPTASKHWKYAENRKKAVDIIKTVQVWRNRLAHCKPVWNEGWVRSNPNQHWSDMLQRIKGKHAEILTCMNWMCPKTAQIYKSSFAGNLFTHLLSEEAVFSHLQGPLAIGVLSPFERPALEDLKEYKLRP